MSANSPSSASGTEHARMLRDSVADFVKRGTDVKRVRRLRDTQPGFDREVWRQMAEFGWLGILVPEQYGGLGLGCAEMAIVAAGTASALTPEPLTAAAVLAAGAIAHGDNEPLKHELLESLAAGALILQEAGGLITDFAGELHFLESGDIVAANAAIHSRILEKVQASGLCRP